MFPDSSVTYVPDRTGGESNVVRHHHPIQAFALVAIALAGCERNAGAVVDQVPVRMELDRDTVIINGPRAVQVPARLVSQSGETLADPQWSLSVDGDSAVRVENGRLACVTRGDGHVAVAAAGFSRDLFVRCRPVVSFGFPPPLEIALEGPPQSVRVNALGPSGTVESLLAYSLSVRDSGVVAVRDGQVHPLRVGRAAIVVDFGGIATAITAKVFESIAAETLRLAPGEFRSWPLSAGRYEITVTPDQGTAWRTALAMETSGAKCVRDSQRDDVIHCLVRERGGLGVRNQSMSPAGGQVVAAIRVIRVE